MVGNPGYLEILLVAVHHGLRVADWRERPAFEQVVEVHDVLDGDHGDAFLKQPPHLAPVILGFDVLRDVGDGHAGVEEE